MVNEFRDDLFDEADDLIDRLVLLNLNLILFADLSSEASEVLVAPADEIFP